MECTRCGYRNPDGAELCTNPGCRAYLGFDGKKVATLPGGIALRIPDGAYNVDPGKEVVGELRIHNRSDVVDAYTISATPLWITVEPQTVSLFPDKEQTVHLRFRPPRIPGTRAGQTPFTVTAISKSTPAVSAEQGGAVDVGTFGEMSAQITPQTSHAKPTAVHQVAVENHGNIPLRVALEASDSEAALTFEIDHPILSIDPGKTELAQLRIRAPEALATGPARQRAFHLTLRPDVSSVPPTTMDGYTVVEPNAHRPRAIWLLLLAPIAALLLVAAFQLPRWFGTKERPVPSVATSRVPDTSNLLAADAARLLGTAGFSTDQAREPSDTTAEGRVIRTDPIANLNAPRNTVVTIIVSSGKQPVTAPAPKPVPQVALVINDVTLVNSEHTFGDVHLALQIRVQLPDGKYVDTVWNGGGAALNEGTTYRIGLPLGTFPADSHVVIVGFTDPDNRTPSIGHAENYQGEIQFGSFKDASNQGMLRQTSRNDKQNAGFRVTMTATALALPPSS